MGQTEGKARRAQGEGLDAEMYAKQPAEDVYRISTQRPDLEPCLVLLHLTCKESVKKRTSKTFHMISCPSRRPFETCAKTNGASVSGRHTKL